MIGAPAGRGTTSTLPLVYLLTAAGGFVAATLAVPALAGALAGHYYQPRILALTHTATLGWITLAIMGASQQLVPVVLERPLWSARLARWQYAAAVVGIAGMVAHFWLGEWKGLAWTAAVVGLASALHLLNLALTLRGLARWTFTARLIALGHAGLALTVAVGLALAVDKAVPFLPAALFPNLHAHVHLALLGWVLPIVLGVAARVYPMFLLAREPEGRLGTVQLAGVALGAPAVTAGLAAEQPLLLVAGALAVAVAVGGHLAWVLDVVRQRRRPALDWGLRLVLAGAAFLAIATVMGLALATEIVAGPRFALAYAVLALGGWASLTITGMSLKIVPFLVWYRTYGPHVGRARVPTLAQLGWPRAEAAASVLLAAGLATTAVAVAIGEPGWIRLCGAILAAGGVAFGAALGSVLRHVGRSAVASLVAATPKVRS